METHQKMILLRSEGWYDRRNLNALRGPRSKVVEIVGGIGVTALLVVLCFCRVDLRINCVWRQDPIKGFT